MMLMGMTEEVETYVARCLKGHETVVTSDTIKPMLDVNKKGTTFVIRCPHVENGTVCGAPAQISQKEVARLFGITTTEAKQMMRDMHAKKTGEGPVAPLQPPVPEEPVEDESDDQGSQDVLRSLPPPLRSPFPVTPRPKPIPVSDENLTDPATVIREERPTLERKYPPIRVIEKKDPLALLKEVITEAGLKDDVEYTLLRVADLMDDGWTTEDFVMAAKQYGISDAVAKGVAMRFKLEWKSHMKQLEEQQRALERVSGPTMGPFTRERGPGESDPLVSSRNSQIQMMSQQVAQQMLSGSPVMQMWAQTNPKEFEEMIRKIVEQTLKSQQTPWGNPVMNPMMMGMNPMMGMSNHSSRRDSLDEGRVKEMIESGVSSAMNDVKVILAQMSAQQRPQREEDPLLKEIVLSMLQNQHGSSKEDPLVGKLLEHILEKNSTRGEVTEQLLAQLLDELKKGHDSRSLDLDHLREMINLRSIEGELSLKQREFDDRRESRELMRSALNEGLTVVGSAIASTMMSRGSGGVLMNQANQQPVQTEMLQTADGSILMSCRACGKAIIAPPDATEIICPFCNAQFPVVEPPRFEPINTDTGGERVNEPGNPVEQQQVVPEATRRRERKSNMQEVTEENAGKV